MSKFLDLYNSFDDFYETFYRGNEVEFLYNGEHYYILPQYNDQKKIIGIIVGNDNEGGDIICSSKLELYTVPIASLIFGDILGEIEIVWNNC